MNIAEGYEAVLRRVAKAAVQSGRDPGDVTLVAVTKTWPAEVVVNAYQCGLKHFGENRAEELADKKPIVEAKLGPNRTITWHAIGSLQSRKTNFVADYADVFHALDRIKIARRLSERLIENSRVDIKPIAVFLEVNVSGELSKAGINCSRWEEDPSQRHALLDIAKSVVNFPGLIPQGLMTMAPWEVDEQVIRDVFRRTRRLSEWLQETVPNGSWLKLSMGMTDDFEIAIQEGATHIRVGRAIFGPRSSNM